MADKIKIDTRRLGTDAESVEQCIKNIQAEMEQMQVSVAEMNKMWDGPANKTFNQSFLTDIEAASVMIRNLEILHTYEKTAKTEYEICERDVSSMIEEIRV